MCYYSIALASDDIDLLAGGVSPILVKPEKPNLLLPFRIMASADDSGIDVLGNHNLTKNSAPSVISHPSITPPTPYDETLVPVVPAEVVPGQGIDYEIPDSNLDYSLSSGKFDWKIPNSNFRLRNNGVNMTYSDIGLAGFLLLTSFVFTEKPQLSVNEVSAKPSPVVDSSEVVI